MESGGTRGDFIHGTVPQKHGLCISDFSVTGTKYSDKNQLKEARVYYDLQFQRNRVHHGGKT